MGPGGASAAGSGEDDDLDARGVGGRMDPPNNRLMLVAAPVVVVGLGVRELRSSLYRRLKGADHVGWEGLRSGSASHSGPLRGQRLRGACRSERLHRARSHSMTW